MIGSTLAVAGIESILSKFDDDEVLSLAATVTQGLLKNKLLNRRDALAAILKYSTNTESFLRRKLITRDVLFEYCHTVDLDVRLPITKDKLIVEILNYWDRGTLSNAPNESAAEVAEEVSSVVEKNSDAVEEGTDVDLMARKFSEWFYGMMNEDRCIATEHFYQDANLKINLINGSQIVTNEVADNVEQIVQLLFRTRCDHCLYFNPNISAEGARGTIEPHGLVMLLCCGTLHINNSISGIFEQVFAVARDPFSDNNWKIKNTTLTLRSKSNVTSTPTLRDTELSSSLRINN